MSRPWTGRSWGRRLVACAGLSAGLTVWPAIVRGQDRVSARLDPDHVVLGATVDLVVTVQPEAFRSDIEDPHLPALPTVLLAGTGREARVRVTNGRVTRLTVFRFTLRPLVAGPLTIPPVRVVVDGRPRFTRGVRLNVLAVSAGGGVGPAAAGLRGGGHPDPRMPPPDGTPGIFAVTRVDRAEAWVGQQVTLTFAFYHDPSVPLLESPDYAPPASPGFWRIELDAEPTVSAERIGARTYHVQRFRYALFPLRPGALVIQPATVRVVEPDPKRWWAAGATRTITTAPLGVVARPLPAGAPAGFDGTVGRFALGGGVGSAQGMVGVPLALELTVSGAGNPTPIGAPVLPSWPDVDTHPPAVDSATAIRAGRVEGRKAFRFLLVPREAGPLGLGMARLPYFDPATGAYAVDTLRLGEIQIAAAPAGATPGAAIRAPAGPTLWPARTPRPGGSRDLARERWYWTALAGPWLVWLGVLGAARARRGERVGFRRRAAGRELERARQALQRGASGAEQDAARAIDGALAARYGVRPGRGTVHPSAAELAGAGVPAAVAAAAAAAWSALGATGYGGQSREAAAAAVVRFVALLGSGRRPRACW
ncbi:MAG: BatD family protein [Gemmatimonadota bacterium]